MTRFSLFNKIAVEFSGTGKKRRYFENEYVQFKSEEGDTVIEVEFGERKKESELILGDKRQHFAKSNDEFLITDGERQIACGNNWQTMSCAELIPEDLTRTLIEGEIRQKATEDAAAMIHASGVKYQNTVTLFPAWRHTGKTNTMILLLQKGAQMLSDDRLWVEADGTVHPYHVPVHILPYNFRSFPDLEANQSVINRVRGEVHQKINDLVAERSSTIAGGINQINRHLIRPTNSHVHLSELFPGQQLSSTAELSNLVFLQTHSGGTSDIQYQSLDVSDVVKKLSAINYYEWDRDLEEVYGAYDHLFPDQPSKRDQLNSLVETQKDIFRQIAEKHDCYELYVPREDRWSDSTKHRIVSQIESMN